MHYSPSRNPVSALDFSFEVTSVYILNCIHMYIHLLIYNNFEIVSLSK